MAANHRLVRILVMLNVAVLNMFFKIRNAKVNRIVRKVPNRSRLGSGKRFTQSSAATQSRSKARGLASDKEIGGCKSETRRGVLGDRQRVPGYELVAADGGGSNLPDVGKYLHYYYLAAHCFNWYLLIKNAILCLLHDDTFARFRYLDCLLLGRFIVNGRVIEVTPYCSCFQAAIRLVWYYTMVRLRAELRLPCVEFLLGKPAHEQYWTRGASFSRANQADRGQHHHSTLLEYQSLLESRYACDGGQTNSATSYKLRPNRTRAAWAVLAKCTLIYHSMFAALYLLLACLFYAMGLPVMLTWPGFAYNYRHCLQWLASERQRGRRSLLDMLANRTRASADTNYVRPKIIRDFFMPFSQLVEFNRLHLLRVLLEFFESLVIYLELATTLGAGLYLSIMMSKDVTIYCESINGRLERLIARLRVHAHSVRQADCDMRHSVWVANAHEHALLYRRAHIDERQVIWATANDEQARAAALKGDVAEIQAMVADLFQIIDSYNKFISLHSIFLLLYWLAYSILISSWIFLPGNESPKIEWYIIHCFATLYVFLMLSYMSDVKTSCRKLYGRITVAMALDEDYTTRKNTWRSLLTFYKPKPLYCFTLIGSVELTYMSGLQLLVWLFSALVVASSFFQVYNYK